MNILLIKIGLRNILRNKLHSLINIAGLSIGIATILFIFLFVSTETSFDNFYPDGERLYRIVETTDTQNDHIVAGFTRYPEAHDIKASIPGVDTFCRVSDGSEAKFFVKEGIHKIERLRFADDNFFTFFNFRLMEGDPVTVLNSAEKIVLSRRVAAKIFGKEDPLGQTLTYKQRLFTISGISDEIFQNTHMKFDALISIKYVEQDKEKNAWLGWGGGMEFLSYLKLTPGVSPLQIEKGLPALVYEKINKKLEGSNITFALNLQNIRHIHINTGKINWDCPDNRSKSSLIIISAIGLLILVLAVVNYISLYMAQKSEKVRSISLLAIHGAGQWQINIQTFTEVLVVSIISSLAGIYILTMLLPILNGLLNTSVTLSQNILAAFLFLGGIILAISLIITLISNRGFSRLKVIDAVKGGSLPENKKYLVSTILVTFQFIIVILFIVSILVMKRQNGFINNMEYGFTRENILTVFPDKEFRHNELTGFKQELLGISEINHVSLTSQGVGRDLTMNGYKITGENEYTMLNVIYADAGFLDCFGMNLTSGRNFKADTRQDFYSIIVNQKLVKRAGWKDPLNQTIDRNGLLTVIGTVEDFNFASLYSEIKPLIIMSDPAYDEWGYGCINIRYQTADIKKLTDKIRKLWEADFPGITYEIAFLDDQLNENYRLLLDQQKIVAFFSILSLLISCMGLFGLTSFMASRRTREIGIRKIHGSKISEVILMLDKYFLKWIIWAILTAVPLAWYAMHLWLQNFAYKTELSWWIFGIACWLVLCIALITVSWQSWRAASMNPVEALRYE